MISPHQESEATSTFSNRCPKWPSNFTSQQKSCEKTQFYLPKFRISQFSIPQKTQKKTHRKSVGEVPQSRRWFCQRLLELISMKRWISAKRISYVVLDEADHMLSTGWDVGMLGCWISVALWKMLVDKQLLLCFFFESGTWQKWRSPLLSATWASVGLCLEELGWSTSRNCWSWCDQIDAWH